MTVENASTIAQLDPARPFYNDPIVEGDDHIRLLKSVLQSDVATKSAFPSGRGDLAARNGNSQYASLANGTTVLADGLAYVRVNGSTAIPDLPGWEPGAEVFVDHFNPLASTTADDMFPYVTLAVNYVASKGGGTVNFIDERTYKISTMVNITADNITMDVGDARIDARTLTGPGVSNRPDAVFNFLGTTFKVAGLAAPVAKDAVTMTLTSAAGLLPGDALYAISDAQLWYTEDTGGAVRRSTLNRVKSVAGSVITLESPNDIPMDIAGFAVTVSFWRGVQNVKVIGGHYTGPGYVAPRDNGTGEGVVYAFNCQDIEVRDIRATVGFQGAWIWVQRCWGVRVINNTGNGKADDDEDPLIESSNMGFTGIFKSECMGVLEQGNHGRRFRHLSDGARSRDVIVRGNHAYDCHRPPFGSHNGCNDWHIDGNYSRSRIAGGSGCLWRGFNVRFTNNYVDGMADTGSQMFYDTVGTAADLPRSYLIQGNTARCMRQALLLRANIQFANVVDNDLYGGVESLSYPTVMIDGLDIGHVRISGGKIETVLGTYGILLGTGSVRTREHIEVTDALITGHRDQAVASPAGSTLASTIFVVRNNTITPRQAQTLHVSATAPYLLLRRGPNVIGDGTIYDQDNTGVITTCNLAGSGAEVPTYSARSMQWSRVGGSQTYGGMVTLAFDIRLTARNGLTGALRVNGLPFLPRAAGTLGGGIVTTYSGATLPAVGCSITLLPISGLDRMDLILQTAVGASEALLPTHITDTFNFRGMCSYMS